MSGAHRLLLGVALFASLAGAVTVLLTSRDLGRRTAQAKAAALPAKISLVKMTAPDCKECSGIEAELGSLKALPVKITEERELAYTSDEARSLVTSLGIARLPTFLVRGDLKSDKISQYLAANGEIKNDVFIFTKTRPVFVDPANGEKRGLLSAVLLAAPKECRTCPDPSLMLTQLEAAGLAVADKKTAAFASAEGKSLIEKFRISSLPTVALMGDVKLYGVLASTPYGTIEKDNAFVLRLTNPPYFDVAKNKISGQVSVVYVTDKSCTACYDVRGHKQILEQGYGVALAGERTVDISSALGRRLAKQYSLTTVPTILLSPEAADYNRLKAVWSQVGEVATDGWYVFQRGDRLGALIYKDLASGRIIRPAAADGAASSSNAGMGH